MPGIPGIPGMPPPWAIRDIILRASKNRSTRLFTALTSTPEPLAIRARREPLMIVGSWRSAGVIDLMIAAVRSTSRSSMLLIWSFICPMPGSMPSSLEMRAHLPDLLHLRQEVVEREVLALGSPAWRPSSRPRPG